MLECCPVVVDVIIVIIIVVVVIVVVIVVVVEVVVIVVVVAVVVVVVVVVIVVVVAVVVEVLSSSRSSSSSSISTSGITNTAGRLLSAVVVQIFRLNTALVTALALLLCGLVTQLYPITESYAPLAAMSAFFGLGMAAYVTLCSVMLCDVLGPSSLASAFGYVTMMRGVASLLGPPLAGAIIDSTQRFDPAFHIGGGMIMLGGVCHLLLYLIYFKFRIRSQLLTECLTQEQVAED
ncbi:monocarboxylate transporter 9 [Elysia marginata]|uniref:Monocarboxylate transporter 9 n=1 Tax=Elysia marginata TaxID=1093978 RepID=A0AAV4H4F1_9GAST|nr:monocarboxylate transporter 9 [Elysia marginata]